MSLGPIKSKQELQAEALERGRQAAERLREDKRIRLINPFKPEKFLIRGDSRFYDPTDYKSLARSLPEMRQLLQELENELEGKLDTSVSKRNEMDQIESRIAQTDFGFVELDVSNALQLTLNKIKYTEFLLEIGGEIYIGLSQKPVESCISNLLHQADNGAMDQVSIQLRRFGHIYKFRVLETHQSEIHGLVGQFISINKYSASLNKPLSKLGDDIGLQTQNYRLTENLNCYGEKVLSVVSIKNEKLKIAVLANEKYLSNLQIEIQKIEEEISELKNSIAKLKPYEPQKLAGY